MPTLGNGRRVAIVAGLRTPFAKSGTILKSLSAQDLGRAVVAELVQRNNLDGKEVDILVFGTVVPSVVAPNIAREVALLPMLPKGIPAVTVSRACASANQAITDAADQIALGYADVAIAGGAESLSNIPILHSRGFSDALMAASKAKSLPARLGAVAKVRPKDLVPITPVIAAPVALKRAGLSLRDIDLVEMHEAFAAQVLSNLRGFESKYWAERAGLSEPVGEVDRSRLNVMGGSIALGHPFGATGARITTTLCNELRRRGGQFGLMTVCAAGGMGFAMVVERA